MMCGNEKERNKPDYFLADKTGSGFFADRNNLFNGNISSMVTTLTNPNGNITIAQGTAYKYDQLNRIVRMRAHRNLDFITNQWDSMSGDDGSYREDYTYNANGSILSLKRNGLASIAGGAMDDLTYKYETVANGYNSNTNKLRQIQDAVASNTYTDDMDNQVQNNYAYDEIGNLKSDAFECIDNIEWTVYGKVKRVTRIPGCLTEGVAMPDLEFNYDATGNTIAKIVKPAGQTTNPAAWETTFYVPDASGNIMATYEQKNDAGTGTASFKLTEKQIYGSAHIGTEKTEVEMIGSLPSGGAGGGFTRTLGKKHYFLTDHRGNNNVTVSDKKIPIEDLNNPGTILYFEPDIVRAVDYFPFGREMNGREFNKDVSEFGYNGKQNIKEWSIRLGGPQNYGARIYDPNCGCFKSIDPLVKKYPFLSPYGFAANSPIKLIDKGGKGPELPAIGAASIIENNKFVLFTSSPVQGFTTLSTISAAAIKANVTLFSHSSAMGKTAKADDAFGLGGGFLDEITINNKGASQIAFAEQNVAVTAFSEADILAKISITNTLIKVSFGEDGLITVEKTTETMEAIVILDSKIPVGGREPVVAGVIDIAKGTEKTTTTTTTLKIEDLSKEQQDVVSQQAKQNELTSAANQAINATQSINDANNKNAQDAINKPIDRSSQNQGKLGRGIPK